MASTKYRKSKTDPHRASSYIAKLIKNVNITEDKLKSLSPAVVPKDQWEQAAALFSIYPPEDIIRVRKGVRTKSGKAVPAGKSACGPAAHMAHLCREGNVGKWVGDCGGYFNINTLNDALDRHSGEVTDADVKAHTFVLLEHDDISFKDQLALLSVLPLPIVSIVDTAGKSLHALVRVNATSRVDYDHHVAELYKMLEPLGFDPSNKNPSRYSRFPGAPRRQLDNSVRHQRLLYLNPDPKNMPIISYE